MNDQPQRPPFPHSVGLGSAPQPVNRPAQHARVVTPGSVLAHIPALDDNAQDFLGLDQAMGIAPPLPQAEALQGRPSAAWLLDPQAPVEQTYAQVGSDLDTDTASPAVSQEASSEPMAAEAYADAVPEAPPEQEAEQEEETEDQRDVVYEEPVAPTSSGASWSEPKKPGRKAGRLAALVGAAGLVAAVGFGAFVTLKGRSHSNAEIAALSPDQHPLPTRGPGALAQNGNAWERHSVNADGSRGKLVAAEPLAKPARSQSPSATPSKAAPPRDPFPSQALVELGSQPSETAELLHSARHQRELAEAAAALEAERAANASAETASPWPSFDDAAPVLLVVEEASETALTAAPAQPDTAAVSTPVEEPSDRSLAHAAAGSLSPSVAGSVEPAAAPAPVPAGMGPHPAREATAIEAPYGPAPSPTASASLAASFAGTRTQRVSRLTVEDVMLLNEDRPAQTLSSTPNVWSATTVPQHLVDGKQRISTPNVGSVRLRLRSGESLEGRLAAVGENQYFLDLPSGRLGFLASGVEAVVPSSKQRSESLTLTETEMVRVKNGPNVVVGRVVSRSEREVTIETKQGARLTVPVGDIEPVDANGGGVVIKAGQP
jgi:hypothetical protein